MIAYRRRPSPGFILLMVTALSGLAFFAWGTSTPLLEEMWRLEIELRLGSHPRLTLAEFRKLQQALVRYPSLAAALLDGGQAGVISSHREDEVEGKHAYLVRATPSAPAVIEIQPADPNGTMIPIRVRTLHSQTAGQTSADTPFVWQAPTQGPFPQLVEIQLGKPHGSDPHNRSRRLALIRWREQS